MKTDTLFYKLLEAQPALLLRLAHLDEFAHIPCRFQSVELKEKSQRTAGILLPDREHHPDAPLIVCEVQFWEDPLIYTRLVSETSLLLLQMPEYRRFQMVLLLRSRSLNTDAFSWQPLCEGGVLHAVYLDEAHHHSNLQERTSRPFARRRKRPVADALHDFAGKPCSRRRACSQTDVENCRNKKCGTSTNVP